MSHDDDSVLGSDKRLGDSVRGRSGVLPCVKCHGVSGQCGKCASFHTIVGSDHIEKHSGYKEFARDLE